MVALSIVLPTRNRPEMIRDALESLRVQSCQDFRIVVVDDGSDPPIEKAELQSCVPAPLSLVRHSESRGGHAAKTAGVEAADTPLVAFLDDDDKVDPLFVERNLAVFSKYPSLDVLFVSVSTFGCDADVTQTGIDEAMDDVLQGFETTCDGIVWLDRRVITRLIRRVPIAFQRPTFRREIFFVLGGFKSLKTMWECDWAIRAVCLKKSAVLRDQLHRWRVSGQGYFTGESRSLDVAEAYLGIQEGLWRDRMLLFITEQELSDLRGCLADAYGNLAYQLVRHGKDIPKAVDAWVRSLRIDFKARRLKFVGQLIRKMIMT